MREQALQTIDVGDIAGPTSSADVAVWAERARLAKKTISEGNWSVKIGQNEHILIEGWTALGLMFGFTAKEDPASLVERGEVGSTSYRVYCQVLKTGADGTSTIVGGAFGACGVDEPEWVSKKRYRWVNGRRTQSGTEPVSDQQRLSMAQTRAASKALSLVLRAIAEMAGYRGTPAEEMTQQPPEEMPPEEVPPEAVPEPQDEPITKQQLLMLRKAYKEAELDNRIDIDQFAALIGCDLDVLPVMTQRLAKRRFQDVYKQLLKGESK